MAIDVERFPKGQPVLVREVLCPNPIVGVQPWNEIFRQNETNLVWSQEVYHAIHDPVKHPGPDTLLFFKRPPFLFALFDNWLRTDGMRAAEKCDFLEVLERRCAQFESFNIRQYGR